MGNKEQEKRILEHVIQQAHNLGNSYIFVIACLNYMALSSVNLDSNPQTGTRAENLPKKVRETLKAMAIPIQGPIWHLITKASHAALAKALDQ